MKKTAVLLVILLILIVAVALVIIVPMLSGGRADGGPDAAPEQAAEQEQAEQTEITNILPEVEQENIDGTVTDSGSFVSSTGTGLEVLVDWSIFDDADGEHKVRLDVSLQCYNLYVSERYNGITIRLGDETKKINSAEIDYTGGKTSILIGSTVMDMPADPTDCEVSWEFKGTYNQTQIDAVTAVGTVG